MEHNNDNSSSSAPEALKHPEEVLQILIDAIQDYAIFILDPQGNVQSWNRGAERLNGYKAHEIVGSHFSRFYTPEDIARQHPQEELKQATAEGRYEEEGWRVRKDGSRFWANVIITALRNAHGELVGFGKVTRNLTERKLAEDALRKSHENLEKRVQERTVELAQAKEEAERAVKVRDEFLSIASHELNTPLTSLQLQIQIRKLNLERGRSENFTPDRLVKMFNDDERQVYRLTRLVEDMLDIARLSTGRYRVLKEEFDLSQLAREVMEKFQPQFQEKGIIATVSAPSPVTGLWDRFRMEQVITNLVSNAIKYGHGKPIHVAVTSDKTHAHLLVRDSGIGIDKKDQLRIFEQFERTDAVTGIGGLGLGLFIVKQIVDFHGGSIRVESKLTRGSTFIVDLPLNIAPR